MEVKTEDFGKVNLVDRNDLKQAFEDWCIEVHCDSHLAKAQQLCLLYDIDAEELVAQWFSFISKIRADRNVTDELLERFEREHIHRKAVSVQTEILDGPKKKIKVETRPSDISILRDYGNMETSTEISPKREMKSNDEDMTDTNGNMLVLSKHVVEYYGESLSTSMWINKHSNKHQISPYNPRLYLDKPYTYMKLNIHSCTEVMDQFMDHLIGPLKEGLNVDFFDEFTVESSTERFYVGKVRVEAGVDGKLTDSILLEMSQHSRRRAKLDLSELSEYSLFPGQLIAVKSTYDFNSGLKPSEIADFNLTISPFSTKKIDLSDPLYIVAATGPFHTASDVNYTLLQKFLTYVKEAKPQFVVLTGPFVDCENKIIQETRNPFEMFDDVMNKINQQLQYTDTIAIIVPSPRDMHHHFIYPTPPFQRESANKWANIHFAPNPCLLDISGIVIAINGVDVLMHMIRNEIARVVGDAEPNRRLMRLCKHFLSQQSFYPLSPADPKINFQYTKLDYLHLPVTPHLFLLSSQLKSFAKKTNGCVFVNNESLSKGIMSRIRIGPLSQIHGTLDKHIDVEIVKL